MKTNGQRYRVTFERDEDGWWVVHAPDLQGCHTQAASLREGRRRIREAMELWDVPRGAEHFVSVDLGELGRSVARVREHSQVSAADVNRSVNALARAGLCKRDIRELLGLSTRRVLKAMTK